MNRRGFLTGAAASASALTLAGCDGLDVLADREGKVRAVLESANSLTYRVQRMLLSADALAEEFTEADIRQPMRPNGVTSPSDETYVALAAGDFADYRLEVSGMVERPLSLDLATLRAMPSRTQVTRHDCVEGWSCIAKWTGAPLGTILDEAGMQPGARFVVFHCMDTIGRSLAGPVKYYESIDLRDAYHPQTIMAYAMNDAALPIANGAPVRVRIERQLGYKMAKYIHAVEVVDSLAPFGQGQGGFWEDRGYEWYAGI
jgi:DMSO/TMAO reductase YedYZ molybdopterin-dependent catalytic subunit